MNLNLSMPNSPQSISMVPLICFSHLRWDFVVQRPQHLMRRFARNRDVYFIEEPVRGEGMAAYLQICEPDSSGVIVVRPHIDRALDAMQAETVLARLISELASLLKGGLPILWFYTPMMYPLASSIERAAVVYDCMDELSAFRFAPPGLIERESQLMAEADVIFTGGRSLFEAKRGRHANIHLFASSIDAPHFHQARCGLKLPYDQAHIAPPILGYYGVIDERIDLELLREVAARRPEWSFVMIGPTAKIDSADLPKARNIHYLGRKEYAELPAYLAGWSVALMPFAINSATRFISPTKTPEYLAAGRPVVSTPVPDVVGEYGETRGVLLAHDAIEFVAACEKAMELAADPSSFLPEVDVLLERSSWETTFMAMQIIVDQAVVQNTRAPMAASGVLVHSLA